MSDPTSATPAPDPIPAEGDPNDPAWQLETESEDAA